MGSLTVEQLTATSYRVVDLGRQLVVGMPQSPNHPEFRHALVRRHGDAVRADGGSAANDLLVTGTHVGTHVDALGHVSHDGTLHGGADATLAQQGGRFEEHGIQAFPPFVGRGVLLDVPRALGVETLEAGYEITPADLDLTVERQGVSPQAGDVILVRSGWARQWGDRETYQGQQTGVPGVGEDGAVWLAGHRPTAAGADTIAFERLAPGMGHAHLPAHRVLLVEHGIHIIETLDLEAPAVEGLHEFLLVVNPLNILGATGAPVRPLAVVPRS